MYTERILGIICLITGSVLLRCTSNAKIVISARGNPYWLFNNNINIDRGTIPMVAVFGRQTRFLGNPLAYNTVPQVTTRIRENRICVGNVFNTYFIFNIITMHGSLFFVRNNWWRFSQNARGPSVRASRLQQ